VSDELIDVIVDPKRSSIERKGAAKQLYERHSEWIKREISRSIYNEDDVIDIAQEVWMTVLQPETLAKKYVERNGKFRALLRQPIRWAILDHINKLPFTIDDDGNKVRSIYKVEMDADIHSLDLTTNGNLSSWLLDEVIENIIKPNLKKIVLRSRNAFVTTEYETIFKYDPELEEVAYINGLEVSAAEELADAANGKLPKDCSDAELSVYMPLEYRTLVDPEELSGASGRYIANLFGVSEAALRKRLHTARKQLIELVREQITTIDESGRHG